MSGDKTITIDEKIYVVEESNTDAHQLIAHIRATDFEIGRAQSLLAIYQTARRSYLNALKSTLGAGVSSEVPSEASAKLEGSKS